MFPLNEVIVGNMFVRDFGGHSATNDVRLLDNAMYHCISYILFIISPGNVLGLDEEETW